MSISSKKGHLSPEFALLGFLYDGPMHGYELHRKLVTDLGHVWHLSQSEAYAILKRLENRGFLSNQPVQQEKLPAKQLLQMTPTGRNHFAKWMESPSSSVRAIRMESLTRLYFTSRSEPANIKKIFNAQQAETEKQIERLKNTLQSLPPEQIFNQMSLEMRMRQLNLVLNWLEDCRTSFNHETPPPPKEIKE